MERLTGKELRRLSTFLRELYQLRTHEEFTSHLVDALPMITEAEFTSYNEIDRRAGTGTFKTNVPGFLADPARYGQVLAQHAPEHPMLQHFERTKDGAPITISDFVSDSTFRETALHKEFYEPLDIPHIMGFALQSDPSRSITVAHHRNGQAFGEHTRSILNAVRPHILQGLKNALAVTRLHDQLAALDQAMEAGHCAMLSVSADGRIHLAAPHAHTLLAQYGMALTGGADWLPPVLRAWLRRQISHPATADDVAPSITPLTVTGKAGTLVIRLMPKRSQYLLMLEEDRPLSPDLRHLGLSPRETEVLEWVVQGKTNPEIGTILSISHRTVQKHLERIYMRLGVENRHAAIGLALAQRKRSR
ncbi:MAG: helix-turn-helix transcriptional regulator [Nitrospira sp.]|nr:helix-turn-helix transcriptional regulator [Nitrospira sp.]